MPNTKPLRMTNAVAVQSSSLAQLAYDERQEILQVEFCDGSLYQYASLPLHTYHELLHADSKGTFFNRYIRTRFPHVAVPVATPITTG